jgi:hypothetical protein
VPSDQIKKNEPLRAAFDKQAKPKLLETLYRVTRARMVAFTSRNDDVNDADVDDMMMGIIAQTLDGHLSWDYERKPLLMHLCDAVQYRVRNEAHARWNETVREMPLDEETTDVSLGEGALAGVIPQRPDQTLGVRCVADKLVAEVRALSTGNRDVELVLDAIVNKRAFERADIIKETGLSLKAYKNARARLDRMLLRLPSATHDAVMTALTN